MNTDPVAKLAKFTPGAVDANELLFAAGRASARTFWGWKAAVAGLLVSNLALTGALVAFRMREVPPAPPSEPPAPPATAPQTEPPQPQQPSTADAPWSYHTLRTTDLDRWPKPQPVPDLAPREPLTVMSGRTGELN